MSKTAKKKTKKLGDKIVDKPAPHAPTKATDEEKPFDFGGLPDRDLKKNLGCGS